MPRASRSLQMFRINWSASYQIKHIVSIKNYPPGLSSWQLTERV